MKKETLNKMLNNPPYGSTHYRRFKSHVCFYKNVDELCGSYDIMIWYADEDYADEYWYTRRSYLDMKRVIKL